MTSRLVRFGAPERLPRLTPGAEARARRLAFALVAVALLFLLKRALAADLEGPRAFLLYDAAIAAAAAWGGVWPALAGVAAGVALGAVDLDQAGISTLAASVLFAVQAAAVIGVIEWVRRERGAAQRALAAERIEAGRLSESLRALDAQRAAEQTAAAEDRARASADARGMREEIDAMTGQLQRLETLTDPALSDLPTDAVLDELMARIRGALAADSAVLVDGRDRDRPTVLGPERSLPVRRDVLKQALEPGQRSTRVHLVQNDPDRLAATSVIAWRGDVATLVSVPVVCAGETLGVIEIAMRRARRWTDWDTALLRIVADRVAWVLARHAEGRVSRARTPPSGDRSNAIDPSSSPARSLTMASPRPEPGAA